MLNLRIGLGQKLSNPVSNVPPALFASARAFGSRTVIYIHKIPGYKAKDSQFGLCLVLISSGFEFKMSVFLSGHDAGRPLGHLRKGGHLPYFPQHPCTLTPIISDKFRFFMCFFVMISNVN